MEELKKDQQTFFFDDNILSGIVTIVQGEFKA
jgi:hypothetical protein